MHVSSCPPGSRCQDRVKSVRDVLRGVSIKIKKRAEVSREKPSDYDTHLISVKERRKEG